MSLRANPHRGLLCARHSVSCVLFTHCNNGCKGDAVISKFHGGEGGEHRLGGFKTLPKVAESEWEVVLITTTVHSTDERTEAQRNRWIWPQSQSSLKGSAVPEIFFKMGRVGLMAKGKSHGITMDHLLALILLWEKFTYFLRKPGFRKWNLSSRKNRVKGHIYLEM